MLMPRAYKDLDAIYEYIADSLDVIETAEDIIVELEDVILSLDSLPYRGAKRKVGAFANKGYRQVFNIGIVDSKTPVGNIVISYNAERTICDLFRNRRGIEVQDLQVAIK